MNLICKDDIKMLSRFEERWQSRFALDIDESNDNFDDLKIEKPLEYLQNIPRHFSLQIRLIKPSTTSKSLMLDALTNSSLKEKSTLDVKIIFKSGGYNWFGYPKFRSQCPSNWRVWYSESDIDFW